MIPFGMSECGLLAQEVVTPLELPIRPFPQRLDNLTSP